jgi:putative transposase
MQRGHNGQAVFGDDDDRRDYLTALRDALRTHGVAAHAFALLDNQVQLLLTPSTDGTLSRAMQALGRRYGAAFNRRHGRSGTLWEGRFRAGVVQAGPHALACMRSIDTAAVRHGLADSPRSSLWTSAPHWLGLRHDAWLTDPPEYWQLGNTPFEREAAYAALLAQDLDAAAVKRIEHAAANGWALGSAEFVNAVAMTAGRPAQPRAKGRPRKQPPAG